MVLISGRMPAEPWWLASKTSAMSWWVLLPKPKEKVGGVGSGGQGVVWEIMVRVREDRNISMLDVYSRALRPALSIKNAAVTTEKRRTTPTKAASQLTNTK